MKVVLSNSSPMVLAKDAVRNNTYLKDSSLGAEDHQCQCQEALNTIISKAGLAVTVNIKKSTRVSFLLSGHKAQPQEVPQVASKKWSIKQRDLQARRLSQLQRKRKMQLANQVQTWRVRITTSKLHLCSSSPSSQMQCR